MKISIITVCYNSVEFIENAINSVLNQSFKNVEYIIIDGGSTDGTCEVINKYKTDIEYFVSEPDKGLYDAMNKGIKFATGDVIGILNSDDIFYDNKVLENIANAFNLYDCDCLFGDLVYVTKNDTSKVIRYWKTLTMPKVGFTNGWHPPHPSFYVKREVYKKYGNFNDYYNFSADFEIMMRFLQSCKLSYHYLSLPFVRMRLGGKTSKNIKNIILGNKECLKAFRENNVKRSPFYLIYRFLMKIKQFK